MFTIVKLDAINSTNSFLKDWAKTKLVKNGTVVVAKNQYSGRGQMHNRWRSEPGKNLTFSLLCRFKNLKSSKQFYLNCAVSAAIYEAIFPIIGNDLSVKWPNDIMADNKKIGGVLVENTVKNGFITQSIIGIGLNVNQTIFPKDLAQATSLNLLLKKEFDLDIILTSILSAVPKKFKMLESKMYNELFDFYNKNLYKINVRANFIDENEQSFKGKIKGVNSNGALEIELDNKKIKSFAHNTIHFL